MEETFATKGIVLNKRDWKENDSLVTIYTKDEGKLNLIARGTKKISSKISGHVEPITFIDLMVIKGKSLNYLGSAINIDAFFNIKQDLDRLNYAGKAMSTISKRINENHADEDVFNILLNFLEILNTDKELDVDKLQLLYISFILKLLTLLGYSPELYNCLKCHKPINLGVNHFDLLKGGLVCDKCLNNSEHSVKISSNAIKVLRYINQNDFNNILILNIKPTLLKQLISLINKFVIFVFGE